MKFTISSSALLSILSTTGKVVSSKNTLPILDYFLFELKDGRLKVTASDLETTLTASTKVDSIASGGIIAAPVKLMLDSLKEFSEQPLTIEADENTWVITLSWKSGSLTIPGTSGLSYPALPAMSDDKNEVELDVDMMINGINKTIFATADDDLRPVMNGIYISIGAEGITFVATDAHKLVKYAVETPKQVSASFILPKKPANLLRGILLKEDDAVKVAFDKKNVVFNLKNCTLVCRLIEGVYPNYNAVIPAANPNKVIVDRIELLNAIKRVAVCSNQATNLIELSISENVINLAAKDLDFSYSANETLSCAYEGAPITIGFKSTFLVDILSNIETPSVVVELADSTRAGVLKPVYTEQPAAQTLMLLMPMMINA
ncbi:MAG: DNA polymerase III subunit beta [Tidjanibacter sp.]|nr:DNA polymerase III subunit beta [Tidjanibacter sp.]